MTAQDQARHLAALEALLADRRNWMRGGLERCHPLTGRTRRCVLGAWMHVQGQDPMLATGTNLSELAAALGVPRHLPIVLNDRQGHEAVMAAIRGARRRLLADPTTPLSSPARWLPRGDWRMTFPTTTTTKEQQTA